MRDAPPVLETERLRLRPLSPDDAEALHPMLADAELMTWWSSGPHASLEETRDYLRPVPEWRHWAITRRGDDSALGWVAAGAKRSGVIEVGYILGRVHWGQGIAREAVTRLLDHLFFEEGQRRVIADTDPENRASRALLESLGFTLEGILRAEWETHIGVRDTALYGLLRDEWAARSTRR
ncbi:GNAT family N-acetyltransferase [Sphingosinithalassobacter sp. CS137]|uniref:GNAT family N-acetyltransferase n=1 Tax=Sphingosinithalassobacter sp. CS137 TaxID=2762748 RepID=UPI00165E64FE|nr:GNAT family N-acetyltransferase [Sphingosinithalassobacter sp. CS137]